MKQVPCWRPTNIRRHHRKFSCLGDRAPRNCAPLFQDMLHTLYFQYFWSISCGKWCKQEPHSAVRNGNMTV